MGGRVDGMGRGAGSMGSMGEGENRLMSGWVAGWGREVTEQR